MTPTNDAAEIAAGLTPTMREAVLLNLRGYFDLNTIRALRRRGLVVGAALTDFGLAVRAHLSRDALAA